MKILVTGDSGFIASCLIPRLIDEGHIVIGIDIVPYDNKNFTHKQIIGDITNYNAVLKAAQNVDYIVHLAAVHADEGPTKNDYYHTNVTGTKVLLDVAHKLKIKFFHFFSSVSVYGDISPADETTPPVPNNNYGFSKLKAEELIINWCNENNFRKAIIMRPTAVYGAGNNANIFRLIKQVSIGKYIQIGNGRNKKAIVYLKNVVSAVIFSMNNIKNKISIYNLIDYPIISINDLVTIIAKISSKNPSKIKIPLTFATLIVATYNGVLKLARLKPIITKARLKKFCTNTEFNADKIRQAGYQQELSTETGLKETIDWNKINNWQEEIIGK